MHDRRPLLASGRSTGTAPKRRRDTSPRPARRSADSQDERASKTADTSDVATSDQRRAGSAGDSEGTERTGGRPDTGTVPPVGGLTGDSIGDRRDRQILVVGDSITGRTLALLLRRAGYEPLVVENNDSPAESRWVHLWPSTMRALRAVDVDVGQLDRHSVVEGVSVQTVSKSDSATGRASFTSDAGADSLVVSTRELRRALAGEIADRSAHIDRGVETVSRREDGLLVEFGDGIQEWFDVVIDAAGSDSPLDHGGSTRPDEETLRQSETVVEADDCPGAPTHVHEVRYPDAYVEYVPGLHDSRYLVRSTTPSGAAPAAFGTGVDEQEVPADWAGAAIDPADVDSTTVRQVRLSDATVDPDWWGTGRVCRCGTAACAMAPASGCRVPLGVEDALALVRELTREPRPITDAVDAYSVRRAERLRTLRQAAEVGQSNHGYPTPSPSDAPFGTLGHFRSVALAPFLDGDLLSIQNAGVR